MSYQDNNISLERLNEHKNKPFANLFYPYIIDNANNDSNISLTIDILNKNELKNDGLKNEDWHNKDRQRGSLLESEPIWGFIETSNPNNISSALSNAFCFSDQKITFYIATEGQGFGYIDDQWLYCKHNLTISVLNIITGENEELHTFNNFSSALDDITRYFNWTIPEQNETAFNNLNLFGMFVLRIEVENTYYYDAELQNEYLGNYPNQNLSLLHLLTYSAGKELHDVTDGGINLLNSPISEFENIENIFEKTIFNDFVDLNDNDLTNDQKRAIVADQVAVLFMSQHPVITADYFPSKILGYGMKEGIRSETIIKKISSYSKKYPEIYELAKDRLFGMLTTVQNFNYISEFNNLFENFEQSNQSLRDPAKILMIDENGMLDNDFGEDGILFNPYVIETSNIEILRDVQSEITTSISLNQNTVDVTNITITNKDGEEIENYSSDVKISFGITFGEDIISRIRYTIWTKNKLKYLEYIDENGTSRSHNFEFNYKDIIYDLSSSSESEESEESDTIQSSSSSNDRDGNRDVAEIIFARIDIEDLNGIVNTFYAKHLIPNIMQGIINLEVFQREDGSGLVDIYYNYYGKSEINNSYVVAKISEDDLSYEDINTSEMVGDFGLNVMPGRNKIVWNPYLTYSDSYPEFIYIFLEVIDADLNMNAGFQTRKVILYLDLPEVAFRRINVEEESEMFISSSSSNTSSSSSSELYSESSSSSSELYSESSESSSSSSEGYSESSSSSFIENIILEDENNFVWEDGNDALYE